MANIWEELQIKNMKCKNRFLRSATWEALADKEGYISDRQREIYVELAKNQVGLICTGYARVDKGDYPNAGMMGIYDDCFIPQYQKLTEEVHKQGSAIMMQIAYGGTKTTYEVEGRTIFAPGEVAEKATGVIGTPMTKEDIETLTKEYALAAKRVKESGFDAVQIHGGHSYLLNQFLSPYYNNRTDEYGGTLENRYRILDEIIAAMRNEVGDAFPIAIKVTCSDFFEGGLTFEEAKKVCQLLETSGVDMIEVSGNIHGKAQKMIGTEFDGHKIEDGGFFYEYAKEIAEIVSVPVYTTGGYSDLAAIEQKMAESNLAGVGICRPLMCEPDLIKRWEDGNIEKAKCVHCSQCRTEKANYCTVFRKDLKAIYE